MASLKIAGGRALSGRVAVEGNKNSALPLIAACLLTDQPCEIANVPRLRDVDVMLDLIEPLAASVETTETSSWTMERHVVELCAVRLGMGVVTDRAGRTTPRVHPPARIIGARHMMAGHYIEAGNRGGVAAETPAHIEVSGARSADP